MKVELELTGLSCMGCVSTVKAALEKAGAKVIKIDLNEAEIEVDSKADIEKFVKVVEEAGYKAKIVQDQ